MSIYEEQTQYRDLLTAESKAAMHELCRKASGGICDNEKVMELLPVLGERLKNIGGKKVYGYLQPDVKQMVDAIVNELAKDENLAKLYDAWYEKRFDILRAYTDTMPPKEPLSQLKEFKATKNMVIKEAMQFANGSFSFEDEQMTESEIVKDGQSSEYDPTLPDIENVEFEVADEPPRSASDEPPHNGEVYVAWTAQYQLAKIYLADKAADTVKIQIAIAWLTKSAEGENQFAQYALAKLYRDGTHVEKNEIEALRLFTLSAEQDNEYAAYALGKLYLKSDVIAKDVATAVKWLTKSADLGNQFAQYSLGKLYLSGEDVPKDVAKAITLLTKASEQKNEFAAYQLGKIYLSGEDVPKDVETALRWLGKSAAQGNQYAQYALGKLYIMGKDVQRDREKALEYFTLAAEHKVNCPEGAREGGLGRGNEYAQFFIDHMDSFRNPSIALAATNLLRHLSHIFEDKAIPNLNRKAMQIDRKR
ncbi:MAG: tetratricopeptide repeat protein [Christensenella sp.]